MPGVIAWETHSGEEVERAIATYICILNPRASRIRPSVGDGGIDVLVTNADNTRDVYQVKRYSTNLLSGQKKDIEKSFKKMLEYTERAGYKVRQWHLVMPLDPTKENLARWFEVFTGGHGIECIWDGRSHIDGWAATMPQVGDYYFDGGMEYVREAVKEALSAARLSDSTNWNDIKESIAAQQRLLDERDPHYSYSFHSYSAFEVDEPPFVYRPGMVMSTAEGRDGVGWVVMDVIAKHSASTKLAPITGTIAVEPKGKDEADAFKAFIDYGIPLPKMCGRTSDTFTAALGDEKLENRIGTLWTIHSPGTGYCGPDSIRLRSRRCSQLELLRQKSSPGSKGEYWEGRDRSGLVSLQYCLDYSPASLRMGLSLSDDPNDNASVDDALASVRCLHDATLDNAIMLVGIDGNAIEERLSSFGIPSDSIDILYSLLSSVSALNRYLFGPIALSTALMLTRAEVAMIEEAVEFCEGRPSGYRYERWDCTLTDGEDRAGEVSLVLCVSPLAIHLQDKEYQLGQCIEVFVGVERMIDEDGSIAFHPTVEYGDNVIRMFPKRQPSLKIKNHVVVCDAPSQTAWRLAVDEARNSHVATQWLVDTCEDLIERLEGRRA